MHTFSTKRSIFVFLAYVLITQSLTTITSEGRVVSQRNNAYQFHNDAERILIKAVRYLIGEYALDRSACIVHAIHKHPSPQFAQLVESFDINIPITDPTCSYKTVTLSDVSYSDRYLSFCLGDLDTGYGVAASTQPIADSGPLGGYTTTAIAKTVPNHPYRLQLLFKNTCKRNELGWRTISSNINLAAIVETEFADNIILQKAGFSPAQ